MSNAISPKLQKTLGYLPGLANLVLVILIGLTASRLIWLVWPSDREPAVPTTNQTSPTRSTSGEVDVDSIASVNLFGTQEVENTPETEVINAPETRLNLKLTGIVSSASGRESRALIKNERNKQESYAVGDTITDNVKLHAIYSNRVILDRSGRFETLTLEQEKDESAVQRVQRGGDVGAELADDLGEVRNQILQNPSTASQYLRLQPERRDGKLVGYRIYPGRKRELFQKAGLRPGELVTEVNGQSLNDPSKALRLLGDLSQASSVTVTLERGDQTRTMTVNFQ